VKIRRSLISKDEKTMFMFFAKRLSVSLVLMVALAGCIIDFDPTESNSFACEADGDCLAPNKCVEGVCRLEPNAPDSQCEDADLDGYGVGAVCLGLDCDDDDANTFPGAPEICDGKDNDCDCLVVDSETGEVLDDTCENPALEIVDEVVACEQDSDCPNDPEADNGMRCIDGACFYRCPLDDTGVCGTSGPDGGGAVRACSTSVDDNTGDIRGELLDCGNIGAYGPDFDSGGESDEACDGLDNNCNRRIDGNETCAVCSEEEPMECSTDLGVCSVGICLCVDGEPDECVDPETMEPVVEIGEQDEVCDGLDNNCDSVVDNLAMQQNAGSICPNGCPFGMVLLNDGINTWCMDHFEASRPDATNADPGSDASRAVSRAGVLPWTNISLRDARDACAGPAGITFASKRLCEVDELVFACGGANRDTYPYGDNFIANTCNGQDAAVGGVSPTGPTPQMGDQDFAACVSNRGEAALFDLSGNAAEFALSNNLGKVFGGSFASGAGEMTCQSSVDGQDASPQVGFRCCFDP
jgi:hypothetical protein